MTKDKMIKKIMQRMSKRADDGIKKYGSTMLHSRKSFVAWIDDAQEELWDAIVYLEKDISKLNYILWAIGFMVLTQFVSWVLSMIG